MLILYVRTGCPYCAAVKKVVDELELAVEEKNIEDPAVLAELMEKGGKRQEPYLIDTERGVSMYESDDIIQYLRKYYAI